jgi:hypothetical protein
MQPERLISDNAATWVAARISILANYTKPLSRQLISIHQHKPISYRFLHEATLIISYRFLLEATGTVIFIFLFLIHIMI